MNSMNERIVDMEEEILVLKGVIAELKIGKSKKKKQKIPSPLSVRLIPPCIIPYQENRGIEEVD